MWYMHVNRIRDKPWQLGKCCSIQHRQSHTYHQREHGRGGVVSQRDERHCEEENGEEEEREERRGLGQGYTCSHKDLWGHVATCSDM